MSNSLGPDQARRFVGPDLGPNSLQRLSADDASRANIIAQVQGRRVWHSRKVIHSVSSLVLLFPLFA